MKLPLLFAQTTAESGCTLNGKPIDCGELAEKAEPFLGLGIGIVIFLIIIAIASFVIVKDIFCHIFQIKLNGLFYILKSFL